MAKRGYKLQEFVAHSGNVNCLRIGKKTCRKFLTGGDDHVVNLWSVGKPEPVTSLNGHSSPIESVAFDSAEVLAVAGASSGVIKLWDLEETKVIHNLTGHRSYCTAVEFHPFGEFLASGSMDTNLKIWDIRKKGCTHTYKGHSRGISTMKFTPDGRWVVSGGLDHVVKVWDLTAGKLLHDFKLHQGHIRSLEFHPFEFLLATGSADRTIKFWDLETFEMISSTKCETAGVRSMKFHPDGTRLFCALDGCLKVYSWEPAICHDSVDMGWSTIGDLCVHDGKLLGGAYYENSVGVWVVDMSVVQLNGGSIVPEQDGQSKKKVELQNIALKKSESHRRSTSDARSTSPDSGSKDIKNRRSTSNARSTSPDTESKDIKNQMPASNANRMSTSTARSTSPDTESKDIRSRTSASNARSTSSDSESKDIKNRMSASNARCTSSDSESKDINNRMSASNARSTSPDSESKDIRNRMSASNARCTPLDTESTNIRNRLSASNARCTPPDTESTDIMNRLSASNARCTSSDSESKDVKNRMLASNARSTSPDSESKDIRNRMSASIARCTPPDTESTNIRNGMSASNARCTPPDAESTDIKNRISASNARCTSSDSESKASNARSTSPDSESKDIRNRMSASIARCTPPYTESTDIRNGMSASNARCTPPDTESTDIKNRISASNARCTSSDSESKGIKNRMLASNARSTSPDSESKDIRNRMSASIARCTPPDTESTNIRNGMSASNARCTPPDAESTDIRGRMSASNARCTSPDTESKDIRDRMPVSYAQCTSPDTESKDIRNRMPASNARCTSPDSESKDIRNQMSVSNARCTSPDTESKDIRNRISTPSYARCTSPDSESTDIKNIYVDSESPVNSKKVESLCSPKVMAPPPDSKEIKSPASQKKQGSRAVLHTKPNESATNKSFVVPIFVPRDNQDTKRDSISTARTNAGTLVRPANLGNNAPTTLPRLANRRKVSATKSDAETVSAAPVSGSFRNTAANTHDYSKRGPISARRPTSTKPEVETVSTPLEYSPSRAKETAMHAKKAHARRPPSTMPAALESGPFGTVNTFDSEEDQNSKSRLMFDNNARDSSEEQDSSIKTVNGKMGKSSPLTKSNLENDAQNEARGVNPTAKVVNGVAVVHGRTRNLVERFEKIEVCSNVEVHSPDTTPQIVRSGEIASTALNNDHPVAGREEDPAQNDILDVQILMQNHDALLSTFTSRLAKLQMIRLFWERNDVKGAIIAMNKLPDHSVQADVVGVLLERVDVITLDLFSCLLPVLLGLLDAKVERHTSVSLEMLLKLVAVFGQLVRSTVSAPPAVGVDLHAEQRVESCKECFVYLQNVQKILPTLIRRGGVLGRYALELNLLLQQS